MKSLRLVVYIGLLFCELKFGNIGSISLQIFNYVYSNSFSMIIAFANFSANVSFVALLTNEECWWVRQLCNNQ